MNGNITVYPKIEPIEDIKIEEVVGFSVAPVWANKAKGVETTIEIA